MKIKAFILITFFILGFVSSYAADNANAFLWYNKPEQTNCTPNDTYQYNSRGGTITGKRMATGEYEIHIPNMGNYAAGVCHATAYGGNHIAQVVAWEKVMEDLKVRIHTFDASGNHKDGMFTMLFTKGGTEGNTIHSGYQWVNDPTFVSKKYAWNSQGEINKVYRNGEGEYEIYFLGIGENYYRKMGNVQVTAYGENPRKVSIKSWSKQGNNLKVSIRSFDMNGRAKDAPFVLSFMSDFQMGQERGHSSVDGAYLWAGKPTNAEYTPDVKYAQNSFDPRTPTKIFRLNRGKYKVELSMRHSLGATILASNYYNEGGSVSISKWKKAGTKVEVFVNTYDRNGNAVDGRFSLYYFSKHLQEKKSGDTDSNQGGLRKYNLKFNPEELYVKEDKRKYSVWDRTKTIFHAATKEEAEKIIEVCQHYGFNEYYFVGNAEVKFTYVLKDGVAATGNLAGERSVVFNANNLEIKKIDGVWWIVDGDHWIRGFERNEELARTTLKIIRRYGFNKIKYVGFPASMTYPTK